MIFDYSLAAFVAAGYSWTVLSLRQATNSITALCNERLRWKSNMNTYERVESLNIALPSINPPAAAYASPYVRAEQTLYVSGHLARLNGTVWTGRLVHDVSLDEGRLAARSVAIDLLATLHHATADLDAIANISKLTVMVGSTPDFSASIWLPIAQANSPLSQTVCAADRSRGSGHACSWRRSSGLAPRHRGRADRTSDRPGSVAPPRTTAVRNGCRSSTQPATSARAVWDQLKAARCSCRTASSAPDVR
jgi:hypothetical protein